MPLSETVTKVKTVSNIYFTDVLGIFQHLTPEKIQKMLQYPANEWNEQGIIEDIKIEKIPRKNDTKAIPWYQQIVERGGIRIDSANGAGINSSNVIVTEGALTRNNNIGFVADEQIGKQGPNGVKKSYGCYFESSLTMCTIHIYQSAPSGALYARWTMTNAATGVHTAYVFHNNSWGDSDRDNSFNNSWDCANYNWYINDTLMGTYISPFELPCPVSQCNLTVMFSGKVFKDSQSMARYKTTGDDSGDITREPAPEVPAVDRQTTLYLKCDVMQRSNDPTAAPEKIKSVSIEFVVQYKTNGGEAIGTGNPRTGVVGIVTNTLDSQLFNIWYKQPNDTAKRCKVYKMYVDTGNGRHEVDPKTWTFTSADRLGIYKTEVYKDNNIFYGNIRTNMLIFANEAAAEGYINKDYDPTTGKLPAPILDGDRTYSPDLPTGDKLTYNGIQTMPTGGLSECWLLDAAGLEQLASIFKTGLTIEENEEFGFFETTLLSTVRGLSMYNSPIDMIVDMFWIPIDISDYCNLGSETQFTVNGEEYAGEYGLSSAYSWVKQRQGDALDMTGRVGNAIGEYFAVKTQQEPTNE